MSASIGHMLDRILDATQRLSAGVIVVARQPNLFQPGCGPGRPVYVNRFLVMHPEGEPNLGTWRLPHSVTEVAPSDVHIDEATHVAGVRVARCVEFKPAPSEKFDGAEWLPADFVISHPWSHPDTSRAVANFEHAQTMAAAGDRLDAKGRELARGVYFDDQPSAIKELTGDLKQMDSQKDFIGAQLKADACYRLFSDAAPPPLAGEPLIDYRKRLVARFQQYSKAFGAAKLDALTCPFTLGAIEDQVFADAAEALNAGMTVPAGTLVRVVKPDASGRPVTSYRGSDGACWDQFNPPIRHVRRFLVPGAARV